jgi:hypothetical protein
VDVVCLVVDVDVAGLVVGLDVVSLGEKGLFGRMGMPLGFKWNEHQEWEDGYAFGQDGYAFWHEWLCF